MLSDGWLEQLVPGGFDTEGVRGGGCSGGGSEGVRIGASGGKHDRSGWPRKHTVHGFTG